MKASLLSLTILGMIAVHGVTGEIVPHETPSVSGDSDQPIMSARCAACCWKVRVQYVTGHKLPVFTHKNGLYQSYTIENGVVNGKAHYTSADGKRALWYQSDGWTLGDPANRGSKTARAYAPGSSDCCPDDVHYTWKYYTGDHDAWLPANKGLSVYCRNSR